MQTVSSYNHLLSACADDRLGWTADGGRARFLYLLVYFCLFVFNACATFAERLSFYWLARRASQNLHAFLLAKVFRLPQSFFDATPSGRVLGRFSRDVEVLDNQLPMSLNQTMGVQAAARLSLRLRC